MVQGGSCLSRLNLSSPGNIFLIDFSPLNLVLHKPVHMCSHQWGHWCPSYAGHFNLATQQLKDAIKWPFGKVEMLISDLGRALPTYPCIPKPAAQLVQSPERLLSSEGEPCDKTQNANHSSNCQQSDQTQYLYWASQQYSVTKSPLQNYWIWRKFKSRNKTLILESPSI